MRRVVLLVGVIVLVAIFAFVLLGKQRPEQVPAPGGIPAPAVQSPQEPTAAPETVNAGPGSVAVEGTAPSPEGPGSGPVTEEQLLGPGEGVEQLEFAPPEAGYTGDPGPAPETGELQLDYRAPEYGVDQQAGPAPEDSGPQEQGEAPEDSGPQVQGEPPEAQ